MDPVVTDADQGSSEIPPTEEPKPEQDAEMLPQNDEFCFKAPLPPIKRGKRGRGAANISIVHSPAARRNGHISAENSTSPPRRGHKSGRGGLCRGSRGGLSKRMARADGQFPAQKASGASGRGRGGRGGANRLVRQDTLPFQTSEEGQNPAALQPVKKVIRVRVNGKYRVRTRVGARVAARMQAARQSAIEKSKKGRGKKAYDLALKKSKRGLGLKASDLTDSPNGAGSDIPPPPPLKFVKHDMFCPMTQNYLEKLTDLPKFASIPKWLHNWIDYKKKHLAGRWIVKARKRIEQMKRDKRRKQTMQLIRATMNVKKECGEEEVESMEIKCEDVSMVDVNERNEDGSEVIKCEDGKISENLEKEISKTAQKDPKLEDVVVDDEPCYSKSSESQNVKRKLKRRTAPTFNWLDEKIPFVQEIILDEYSVLGFTSMHDQKIFDDQIEALRLTELDKVKTKKAEKARRCTALRKKIKLRRYVILKYQRQQRKRQRLEKRERQIVERKAKYDTLKKLVKEAIEKDEFSEELRTQWIQIREKRKKRREERRKRKSEHEARKEARRASRPRRRNGKKRAKERKKKRERAARSRAASVARMMKSPGIGPSATTATAPQVLVPSVSGPTSHTPPGLLPIQPPMNDAQMPTNLAPIMLGEKRPASGHPGPSPSPIKTAKLDPEIYKNGIIGIAKSSSGTPPVVRTPLSHESLKPHTTSAESSHPSDPGHRIASARATPLSSLPPSAASLFINTNAPGSQPQPTAELLQQLAAAAAGQGPHPAGSIDPLRLLNGHPALAQFTAGSLTAGANPFLAAAAASTTGGLPLFNPQMFLQSQAQQLQQVQASQSSQQASAMIQQAALNAAVAQHLPAGLQFPSNAALGSQLAGAALLGSQNAANAAASSMANKKPGRWCGMHVKIAMQIDEHKKQLAKQGQLAQHPGPSSAHPSTSGPIGSLHHSVSTAPTTSTQPIMSSGSAHSTASGASSVATDPALNRLPPPADMAQLLQAAQQHHAQQQLLAAVAVSRSALISGQPSAGPGQSAPSLTPQQNAQPHCLPSTSTAQQPGLPLSFPPGLLASLPPFAQPNPHLMSAALQEATRRVAATPKPAPTSLLQPLQQNMSQGGRTSSVMSRGPTNQPTNPGQPTNFPAGLPSGLAGLPPGFHLGASGPGLSLPPPAAGASLTNGTSDAAAQQQALLHAVMMQHQQQSQQAEQQRREQAQREQHQLHAQQQQQQAAQLQAHQQLLASAAAQQHLLGIQTSSANANPAAQLAARNAAADQANVMALMQQIQMMQQLGNPGQALQLLAQLQAHQSGGLAAATPTPSAAPHTQAPPTSALNQPNQIDLLRAQLEQHHHNPSSLSSLSQPNHLLMAQAVQQQQQQQQQQAQAQTSRANPLDSDAFMRMYSSQQQLSAANNSANSNPSGRPAVFEALLALQASQGNHQGSQQPGNRLGLPPAGLPGLGLPQQQGIPGPNPNNLSSAGPLAPSSVVSTATSQNGPSIGAQNPNAALFAPLLGLPNLSAPQNFLGQKLPFPAGGLQQMMQMKQNELAPPNGR